MSTLALDVRHALRALRRAPVLAAAAVVSLALGIGASTAVFSLVHAVVLRALPVQDVDGLVGLFTTDEKNAVPVLGPQLPLSWPNLEDIGRAAPSLAAVAAYTLPFGVAVAVGDGTAEQMAAELVSGNYFDVLGVRAALGRTFAPEEDRVDGDAPVVVVSDRAFRRRFGADSRLVGQTLHINGHVFTVVGVMPPGFDGVNTFVAPDVWVPRRMHRHVLPSEFQGWLDSRRALFLNGIGRLRPGASGAALDAQLGSLGATLASTYPQDNAGRGFTARPLADTAILPGVRDLIVMGGTLLMGLVSLVVLVACANVANILLARASGRSAEMAVRAAVGADRRRLLRLLLVEAALIAVAGGTLGLGVAQAGVDWLWYLRPPGLLGQNFVDITLDGPVLAYAAAVTLGTTLLFGLLPALSASRVDLAPLLNETGRTGAPGRASLRRAHALIGGQVAASLVVLSAGVMLRESLGAAQAIDPGFDLDRTAVVQLSTEQAGFDRSRAAATFDAVLARVRSLPPVASAAWSQMIPLYGNGVSRTVQAWEVGNALGDGIISTANVISDGFFEAMGMPLRDGRDFARSDRNDTPAVVIVNETLAARLWPGQSAVGRQLRLFGSDVPHEVVGVAPTTRYTSLGETPQPAIFRPLTQEHVATMALIVRSTAAPAQALGAVLSSVRAQEPNVPIPYAAIMRDVAERSLWATQLGASVLQVLGAIGLVLAAVGVFGVAHYAASLRQHEVAVRVALGARPVDAARAAVGRSVRAVSAGAVVGAALSIGLIAVSRGLLYDAGWAPLVGVALAGGVLVFTGAAATAWPARLATRVDPIRVLR